jgi:hypothetical protein
MTATEWSDEQIDALRHAVLRMHYEDTSEYLRDDGDAALLRHLRDALRSALRAAGIVPNGARWRPISEAPKDGTRVLVIDAAHDGAPQLAWWGAPVWGQLPACWLTYSHRSDFEDVAAPTHFQPLPAPPTTEAP